MVSVVLRYVPILSTVTTICYLETVNQDMWAIGCTLALAIIWLYFLTKTRGISFKQYFTFPLSLLVKKK